MSKDHRNVKNVRVFAKHLTEIKIGEVVVKISINRMRKRRVIVDVQVDEDCHVTWENGIEAPRKTAID